METFAPVFLRMSSTICWPKTLCPPRSKKSFCIKTTNEIGPLSCNSSLSFCQRLPSLQILVRGFFCLFRDIGKGEVWLVNLPIGIKRQLVEYNENGRHCIAG